MSLIDNSYLLSIFEAIASGTTEFQAVDKACADAVGLPNPENLTPSDVSFRESHFQYLTANGYLRAEKSKDGNYWHVLGVVRPPPGWTPR